MATVNEKRLYELRKQLDAIIENPGNCTVGEYAQLSQEYSNMLRQLEADRNLRSQDAKMAQMRDAISRMVNEKL